MNTCVFSYLDDLLEHIVWDYLVHDEADPADVQVEEFTIEYLVNETEAKAHGTLTMALWDHADIQNPVDGRRREYPSRIWALMRTTVELVVDNGNKEALEVFAAFWIEHLMDKPEYLRNFLTNTPSPKLAKIVIENPGCMGDSEFLAMCREILELLPDRDRISFRSWLADEKHINL